MSEGNYFNVEDEVMELSHKFTEMSLDEMSLSYSKYRPIENKKIIMTYRDVKRYKKLFKTCLYLHKKGFIISEQFSELRHEYLQNKLSDNPYLSDLIQIQYLIEDLEKIFN